MCAEPAVCIEDVCKDFETAAETVRVLYNASLAIAKGEFFTLLGPSGCGKTTLLRLIAGFEYPTSGRILLEGRDIAALPPFRRQVNTVFQSYALFPHMSVEDNIAFGLHALGHKASTVRERVDEMLRLVKLEPMRRRRPSQLSGGQQQRVALARALAPEPKVLLLDEPLSALDSKLRKEMQIELKRLQIATGITFVFVTHDQEEALTMSDRVAVMSAGRILQVDAPQTIYDRPTERFVADFIGETNFLDASVEMAGDRPRAALSSGKVVVVGAHGPCDLGEKVCLTVRPERARLTRKEGSLDGTVRELVYLGTDTLFHIDLHGGGTFIVRAQNAGGTQAGFAVGERVGIAIPDGAAQIVRP